jgi:hypothetical protein
MPRTYGKPKEPAPADVLGASTGVSSSFSLNTTDKPLDKYSSRTNRAWDVLQKPTTDDGPDVSPKGFDWDWKAKLKALDDEDLDKVTDREEKRSKNKEDTVSAGPDPRPDYPTPSFGASLDTGLSRTSLRARGSSSSSASLGPDRTFRSPSPPTNGSPEVNGCRRRVKRNLSKGDMVFISITPFTVITHGGVEVMIWVYSIRNFNQRYICGSVVQVREVARFASKPTEAMSVIG